MNFFIGAFYDGVYLLGMALNETLTAGGNIFDGKRITKLMWNRTFEGKTLQKKFFFLKNLQHKKSKKREAYKKTASNNSIIHIR